MQTVRRVRDGRVPAVAIAPSLTLVPIVFRVVRDGAASYTIRFASRNLKSVVMACRVSPLLCVKMNHRILVAATRTKDVPPLRQPARNAVVGWWLIACAVLVFAMVVAGGVTRLTGSGLSMVRWHPVTGVLPPIGEEAWRRELDAYRASPEYRLVNRGMSLAEFKRIFRVEYAHRMLGRGVAVAFLVPFLVFIATRSISGAMIPRLAGVFVLGGAQGVLGWYMVRSGLVDEPRVSQYRLAAHLSLAVAIYVYLLALALHLLNAPDSKRGFAAGAGHVRWPALAAGFVVFLTVVMGAFVAGLKAGFVYPTFPRMGEYWVPPGMLDGSPWWREVFENPVTAQFTHRALALASCFPVLAAWGASLRAGVARRVRLWAVASLFAVVVQVVLGVSTLLLHVPIPLAVAHQAGAIALLTCLTGLYCSTRPPRLAFSPPLRSPPP